MPNYEGNKKKKPKKKRTGSEKGNHIQKHENNNCNKNGSNQIAKKNKRTQRTKRTKKIPQTLTAT